MRSLRLPLAAALCAGCGLHEVGAPVALPPPPPGWRVGLETIGDRQCLTVRLRTQHGEVAAAADGVRLAVGTEPAVELPFTSPVADRDSLRLVCRADVPDHAVSVRVTPQLDSVHIEVEDSVELPSAIAELSLEFRLLTEGAEAVGESFAPLDHAGPDELAGDVAWRTPLAYVRTGDRAMAVLPDVTEVRPRVLPGALEVRDARGPRIRHGLMAQRVVHGPQGMVCLRDPIQHRRVAGQTIGFAQQLRLWPDAQPRTTLAEVARDLWQHLVMDSVDRNRSALAPRAADLLDAGGWRGRLARPEPGIVRFGWRDNALLVAAALATIEDDAARSAAHDLVHLALGAPQRSGLSPNVAHLGSGRPRWASDPPLAGTADLYDATAVAWTRVCGLRATRGLLPDDPDRRAAERAARQTAEFLLANQRPNGAIPALYDAAYLAPVADLLAEPAPEAGTAALLLAECAALDGAADGKWRKGAVAAVTYLLREVAPERAWYDRATWRAGAEPRTHSVQNLTFAALAALRLLDLADHADLRAAATVFLDELALQQQLWSPLWLAADPSRRRLVGGFGAHDADPTWSDPVQALAGLAFLHGYEHLGRRDFVQRGAFALRAALAAVVPPGDADASPSPGAVAAAACQLALHRFGSLVVDVRSGYAEPIEALEAELIPTDPGRIELRARCADRHLERVRAVFYDLPESFPLHTLVLNQEAPATYTRPELADGIVVRPLPLLATTLAPPSEIQFDRPFTPRLQYDAPPLPGWKGRVEVRRAAAGPEAKPLATLELVGDDPRAWRTEEPFLPSGMLRLGDVVRLRAELEGPEGQQTSVLATNPTTVGTQTVVAVAGLNEVDCLSPDACPRVLFVDGDRLARIVGSGEQSLVWQLAVPRTALELELEVLLAGRVRLLANDSVVHEDAADAASLPRRLRVGMTDRRLWESGRLRLTFTDVAPLPGRPLQVAELRTRVSMDAGIPTTPTASEPMVEPVAVEPERARSPDSQLSVLVVPIALNDAPLSASEDQLATLFFGSEYRRTPGPEARATTGSVREVLAAISGGRTALVGDVAAPLQTDFPAIDLAGADARAELAALAARARAAGGRHVDVVVVVHSGRTKDAGVDLELLPAADGSPMVSVAERALDGSILPVGCALAAVLLARYGLQPKSTPETGNFGALTLAGRGSDHRPAAPIGIDLARLGWADVIDVSDDDVEIVASAVQRERRIHRVATDLPGRGELRLEVRGGLAEEPDLPECGLLAYWQLPHPPLLRGRDGQTAWAKLLRLPRAETTVDAPFVAGTARELVRRAQVLDDLSDPPLATPEGELCFVIEDLATVTAPDVGERVGFRLRRLTRPLLGVPPVASVMLAKGTWTPLPTDGHDRGFGSVHVGDRFLTLRAHRQPLRVAWQVPVAAGHGQRLFARGPLRGAPGRLRVGRGDEVLFDRVFEPDAGVAVVIDSPATSAPGAAAWLELTAQSDAACELNLDELVAVPLARVDQVPLRGSSGRSAALSDGFVHAPVLPLTTPASSHVELTEPLLIPAGRTMLRLRCGFAADAEPQTAAVVNIETTSVDGKRRRVVLRNQRLQRGTGTEPLLTALLALGNEAEAAVSVLHLSVDASPGTTLWLADLEVARP